MSFLEQGLHAWVAQQFEKIIKVSVRRLEWQTLLQDSVPVEWEISKFGTGAPGGKTPWLDGGETEAS
jgi:hypothetical protein